MAARQSNQCDQEADGPQPDVDRLSSEEVFASHSEHLSVSRHKMNRPTLAHEREPRPKEYRIEVGPRIG
jgi:hypothetical protein